jgi:hypothetical protein
MHRAIRNGRVKKKPVPFDQAVVPEAPKKYHKRAWVVEFSSIARYSQIQTVTLTLRA